MKKVSTITIIILLIPVICFAGSLQKKLCGVIEKKNTVIGCNPDTNKVGDSTSRSLDIYLGADDMVCMLYTADCTGTLSYGHVQHYDTGDDNAKICVYNSADQVDQAPHIHDTLIACSTGDRTTTSGWITMTGELSGAVTSGKKYYVCTVAGAYGWTITKANSGGNIYVNTSSGYTTPPANLDGTWNTTASRSLGHWVGIK